MEGLPSESPTANRIRYWPEMLLVVASAAIFVGCLGSPELWGKREQRAAAEAIDTIDGQRWLVAEIQGRPRLEKPPLPRWITASLMQGTGCRTEAVVRLPSALAGLATVILVYSLGFRIGGRRLAITAAAALCTMGIFISEHRQAGNDGMLGLFTILALHAAWCLIHDPGPSRARPALLVFSIALGLGFLCKGPIILMLVGVTVFPYLICTRRLKSHGTRFIGLRESLVFLALAMCWPVSVLIHDPNALGVWLTEMGQKTGALPIGHRDREILGMIFPVLGLPWSVLAITSAFLPFVKRRHISLSWQAVDVWFPWWWTFGNLAIFSVWAVAKPNYFVPCMPGLAILVAMVWLRLCATARELTHQNPCRIARVLLFLQWLLLIVSGALIPLLGRRQFGVVSWVVLAIVAGLIWSGAILGAMLWRKGKDALAPLPIAVACALGVLLGYGLIAPLDDPARGHARLAAQLERLLPADSKPLRFFHEIDEGLWFYLHGRRLAPIPGTQPRYSESYDQVRTLMTPRLELAARGKLKVSPLDPRSQSLLKWLRGQGKDESFVILRASLYDQLSVELNGLATPIYREQSLKRNELILLRVADTNDVISEATPRPPASINR